MVENESETSQLTVLSFGISDRGKVRQHNEDTIFCNDELGLYILADGMGGHSAGKVASERAVNVIEDYLCRWRNESDFVWPFDPNPKVSDAENHISIALRVANVRVYNDAQLSTKLDGMGTTGLILSVQSTMVTVGHVGDSRCYRFDMNGLTRLTDDHSLVNQLMRAFNLTEKEATEKAGKNVLVQSIGIDDDIMPQVRTFNVGTDALFLLCSDGLTDMLTDADIEDIMSHPSDTPERMGRRLVQQANENGGMDNISVILVHLQNRNL